MRSLVSRLRVTRHWATQPDAGSMLCFYPLAMIPLHHQEVHRIRPLLQRRSR